MPKPYERKQHSMRHSWAAALALAVAVPLGTGCAGTRGGLTQNATIAAAPVIPPAVPAPQPQAPMPAQQPPMPAQAPQSPVKQASYTDDYQPPENSSEKSPTVQLAQPPAYAAGAAHDGSSAGETLPIDLPTALRLVDANNPTIALARQRVQEAYLRQRQADFLWLPDLQAGPTYDRHDGRDQNSNGTIFSVSKQSLLIGGGASLDWNTPEILYGPLAAQRLTEAEQANSRAVSSNVQLDAAVAYLDLLRVHARMAIYDDAMARAEEMLTNAEAADKAGLSKTTADINRARAEVDVVRDKRFQLEGAIGVASARLARLLLLRPTVRLNAADPQIAPITLVPDATNLDALVATALSNRPEVRQNRALVAAATTRYREAQVGPFIPHLQVNYEGGEFGGGVGSQMADFGASSEGEVMAYWQLHNLGAGDAVLARTRQVQVDEANLGVADIQSRVAEEVTAAAEQVIANQRSLETAQQAVEQALETWRRLRQASFGLAGAEHQYDPLQPLIALRDLADARNEYLNVVIDYSEAQFRLYWALGQPPICATPNTAGQQSVRVPVVPEPYMPAEEVPAPPPPKASGK